MRIRNQRTLDDFGDMAVIAAGHAPYSTAPAALSSLPTRVLIFTTFPLDDTHLVAPARYVEPNPVRATCSTAGRPALVKHAR